MIEETGWVVQVDRDGAAWVETERRSTCSGCGLKNGCGSGVLAQVLGRRRSQVRAHNLAGAGVGDQVLLSLQENALLRGSLAVYLVPLLLMFGGALLGEHLEGAGGPRGEAAALLLGAIGLAAGFAWVARFARAVAGDPRYQPVIARRLQRAAQIPPAATAAGGEVR